MTLPTTQPWPAHNVMLAATARLDAWGLVASAGTGARCKCCAGTLGTLENWGMPRQRYKALLRVPSRPSLNNYSSLPPLYHPNPNNTQHV